MSYTSTTTSPLGDFFSNLLAPTVVQTVVIINDNAGALPQEVAMSASAAAAAPMITCMPVKKPRRKNSCSRRSITRWVATPTIKPEEEASKGRMNSPQRPQRRGSIQLSLLSLDLINAAPQPMVAAPERRRRRRGATKSRGPLPSADKLPTNSPRKPQRRASIQDTTPLMMSPAAA